MYYNTQYIDTNQGDNLVFLKNLAKIRKEKGLTQEGLARKADISYHTLVKLESGGIRNPKIDTVVKLAEALGIGLDELVRGSE